MYYYVNFFRQINCIVYTHNNLIKTQRSSKGLFQVWSNDFTIDLDSITRNNWLKLGNELCHLDGCWNRIKRYVHVAWWRWFSRQYFVCKQLAEFIIKWNRNPCQRDCVMCSSICLGHFNLCRLCTRTSYNKFKKTKNGEFIKNLV